MDTITTNSLAKWRHILESALKAHADLPSHYTNINDYVIVDRNLNHFILMREGWHGKQRFHGPVVHAEIRENKIWIQYDGIEDSITEELVAAGIPKDAIVLGFHPPHVREHTGYAIV
ncbi:MAG: XisI protein [Cyanobacteria bacterium J06581_3]